MSKEDKQDELTSLLGTGPTKLIVVLALLSGTGNGLIGLTADTSDRFKGADFDREISIRDQRIHRLEQELSGHLQHSARYTQVIERLEDEVEDLEDELEDYRRGRPQ